jgi:hypothetical protein
MRSSHLTGDLKLIAEQVSIWAAGQPQLVRLWFFGNHSSRPAQTMESDLDIAFETDAMPPAAALDALQSDCGAWKAEVSSAIGLDVRFEPIAVDVIQDAVTDHGILVYERQDSPPCRWLAR